MAGTSAAAHGSEATGPLPAARLVWNMLRSGAHGAASRLHRLMWVRYSVVVISPWPTCSMSGSFQWPGQRTFRGPPAGRSRSATSTARHREYRPWCATSCRPPWRPTRPTSWHPGLRARNCPRSRRRSWGRGKSRFPASRMPLFTRAPAISRITLSLTCRWDLFQLFQPMGGVLARPLFFTSFASPSEILGGSGLGASAETTEPSPPIPDM
jgi:hypothetical protein